MLRELKQEIEEMKQMIPAAKEQKEEEVQSVS